MIRVLVADDDTAVCAALVELIGDDPVFEVIGTASSAAEAVALAGVLQPDVALVDVRMPGGGPEAVAAITRASGMTAVVACSAFDDDASRRSMLDAGAAAYVVKGAGLADLLPTLRAVAGVGRGDRPTATT